jgi:hypothetical protein
VAGVVDELQRLDAQVEEARDRRSAVDREEASSHEAARAASAELKALHLARMRGEEVPEKKLADAELARRPGQGGRGPRLAGTQACWCRSCARRPWRPSRRAWTRCAQGALGAGTGPDDPEPGVAKPKGSAHILAGHGVHDPVGRDDVGGEHPR